jgi:hypothetical protein
MQYGTTLYSAAEYVGGCSPKGVSLLSLCQHHVAYNFYFLTSDSNTRIDNVLFVVCCMQVGNMFDRLLDFLKVCLIFNLSHSSVKSRLYSEAYMNKLQFHLTVKPLTFTATKPALIYCHVKLDFDQRITLRYRT